MIDVSWEQIWGSLITAILAWLVKVVATFIKEHKEKYKAEQERKDQIITMLIENNKELMSWRKDIEKENDLLKQELDKINQKMELITSSDLIILKDRLLQSCHYFIRKGEITVTARDNITEMYACYRNMGGNGTGELVYKEAMTLPLSDLSVEGV